VGQAEAVVDYVHVDARSVGVVPVLPVQRQATLVDPIETEIARGPDCLRRGENGRAQENDGRNGCDQRETRFTHHTIVRLRGDNARRQIRHGLRAPTRPRNAFAYIVFAVCILRYYTQLNRSGRLFALHPLDSGRP
jgi:hypothetical protein